jgi:hypothetical protein
MDMASPAQQSRRYDSPGLGSASTGALSTSLPITDVVELVQHKYTFKSDVIEENTGALKVMAITAWMEFILDNTRHLAKTRESRRYDTDLKQQYRGRKVELLLTLLNGFLEFESADSSPNKEVPKSIQVKIDLAKKLIEHREKEEGAPLTQYERDWLADGAMPFRYGFLKWILELAVNNRGAEENACMITKEVGLSTEGKQQDEELCRLINNVKRMIAR